MVASSFMPADASLRVRRTLSFGMPPAGSYALAERTPAGSSGAERVLVADGNASAASRTAVPVPR